MVKSSFSPGDYVFAKVKGYPPWPAQVLAQASKSTAFRVYFFGTYENANVKKNDLWPYNQENITKFGGANVLKRKGYQQGLNEIEAEVGKISDTRGDDMEDSFPQFQVEVEKKSTLGDMEVDIDNNNLIPSTESESSSQTLSDMEEQTEMKLQLEIAKKAAILAKKRKKLAWLQTEVTILDLDRNIKLSLNNSNPQMIKCSGLLLELLQMEMKPLMLIKHPDILMTIRKLRKYVGPADMREEDREEIQAWVEVITTRSGLCYNKFAELFPEFNSSSQQKFHEFFKVSR